MKLKHLVFFSLLILLYSCKTEETKAEQLATIRDGATLNNYETCGWVIQFDNEFGSIVVPVDLDPAFQQDNLKVEVILTNSTEPATCRRDAPPKVIVVFIKEITD